MPGRGSDAYTPYCVVMVGALPPHVGHVVHHTRHHVLRRAIDAANAWCDLIGSLGTVPDWPYSFGVRDARTGIDVYMTDTTERNYGGTATRQGFGAGHTRH